MKQLIMISLIISVAVTSCKKDKDEKDNVMETYPSYSMLKPGNYWVYRVYEITPSGSETLLNQTDSCYVVKDTTINGKVYAKMYRPHPDSYFEYQYLRDSLHYIVNSYGSILFSSVDFSTVFSSRCIVGMGTDTIYRYTSKMFDKDMLIFADSNIFKTTCFRKTYYFYPGYALPGQEERLMERRHAAGVGIVKETLPFSIAERNYQERRLVRYHVN